MFNSLEKRTTFFNYCQYLQTFGCKLQLQNSSTSCSLQIHGFEHRCIVKKKKRRIYGFYDVRDFPFVSHHTLPHPTLPAHDPCHMTLSFQTLSWFMFCHSGCWERGQPLASSIHTVDMVSAQKYIKVQHFNFTEPTTGFIEHFMQFYKIQSLLILTGAALHF